MKLDTLVESLTKRELEILTLLAGEASNNEIAARLNLSVNSVKWYTRQIYGKLGVENRRQAVLKAGQIGLLHPDSADPRPARAPQPPHNLPLQLTSFIGREKQIEAVFRLVEGYRLVTLTGSGGAGKTRLSLRVAEELLPAFADGAWLVELDSLSDPSLIPQAVGHALGLSLDGPSGSLKQRLVDALRSRQILLVLDNCEHLITSAALLAEELLHACPGLRILTTSREVLGVPGEMAYRVPSLSFPSDTIEAAILAQYEAVQLFLARVRPVLPSFVWNESSAQAVARICRRLDGIPLAIELAAARANVLSVEQIAERLDDAFREAKGIRLLSSGSRTALPRQQTLRAAIDWSYNLLSSEEQSMLRQLSVFAGGWSLEASQAVSELNTKPQDDVEVLDLLSHLVDKSLVLVDRLPDGEPRYHILATIRQYLQEKLDQAGEARSTYFAHLEYFLRLAETAEPLLVSKAQLFWLHKLDQEQDNLREALRWAQGNKLAEAALRLTGALHTYMDLHGNWDEHTRWVLSAVELGKSDPSARASLWLANALLCAGSLLNLQQNYLAGKPLLDEALQIYQQHENVVGVGRTFLQLAINAIDQFNFPVIRQYLERAMHILQDAGDHYGLALCLNLLGGAATWEWNIPAARSFFEQGLKELESVGTPNLIFASKVSLAEQLWFQGEAVQSCMILEEILPESRRYCGKNLIFHLDILGLNLLALGKYRQAQSIFEENYALTRAQGMIDWPIYTLSHFGELAFSEGNLSRARAILEEAIQQGRETSADCLPWQLWLLGQVALKEGNLEQAEALVEECIAKQAKAHFHRDEHNTYLTRGSIALEKGNIQRAGQILHDCLSMTRERHILFMAPANLEALAKLAVANGQCERSARLFAAAATLRKRFGTPLPPVEASAVQKHLEAARSSLEPAVFQSAWEWGAAQPVEDVIAYALGEVG